MMDLFLQFGFGMKALTLDLAKKWGNASVILSPRDMSTEQLSSWSKEFNKNNIRCLFDPQCYCPKSELKNLSLYDYWDCNLRTNLQSNLSSIDNQVIGIQKCNTIANTSDYILPCILNSYDDKWQDLTIMQITRFADSANQFMRDKPILATIALPMGLLLSNEKEIDCLIQKLETIKVEGFYLIAEAYDKKYLIDNPQWISNVLYIAAALKLMGKKVIYGYGNHQLLPLALTRIDAMASGTWQNVRSFTNRFIATDDQKRKSTWIYYPEAFSEYKMVILDWAYNSGVLSLLRPKNDQYLLDSIDQLFSGKNTPSMTGFTETDAFKYYLCCLKKQIDLISRDSYSNALDSYELLLTVAERELETLERKGIYAGARSFKNFIDVNRAAISRFDSNFGFQMKMSWNKD